MFDASRVLGGLIGGALPGTASKALRHASRGGGTSSLLNGAAVPGGVLGLLGGLAIAAYEHYDEQRKADGAGMATPPPPPGARQTPPPPPGADHAVPPPPPGAAVTPPPAPAAADVDPERAMLLIQAMFAAAKADGEVDAEESRRILGKLEEAGASTDERAWVMAELAKPLDVAALIERTDEPELALAVYAASAMAIEIDTDVERRYLADLRDKLRIDPSAAEQIHQTLGVPMM